MADSRLARTLEEAGLSRRAAEAVANALDRDRRRPRAADPWMLAYAALLVGGFGWTAARFDAVDAKIDTLDAKVDAVDAKIDAVVERLARLETIIDERLSPPR